MNVEYAGHGALITLHFALRLPDGGEVDSTFDGKPGTFCFGDGTLPEGFERRIQGMRVGEHKVFDVPPEDAFGQPNPNNVQTFPRSSFGDAQDLEVGMMFSFADASQSELTGVVQSISDEEVVVDFNHPLAGKTLSFEVKIEKLEAAPGEGASDGR